jgi:CRP-like cAMP-binding protein
MNTLKDKFEAIAESTTLKATAKSILFSLATFDMYDYKVALSQADLMEYSGIGSRNTISKTIKELESLGWLKVTKTKTDCGHYGNNVYEVLIPLENDAN